MSFGLFEGLSRLRSLAASLLDKGQAQGLSQNAISVELEPLMRTVNDMIYTASKTDVDGLVTAIKMFEHEQEGFILGIKYYQTKIADSQAHIDTLKLALKNSMDEVGVDNMIVGGKIVTIKNDLITIR